MSDESIKAPSTSDETLNPSLYFVGAKASVRFTGDYLKQEKNVFNHGKLVNIINFVYEIGKSINISRYPT